MENYLKLQYATLSLRINKTISYVISLTEATTALRDNTDKLNTVTIILLFPTLERDTYAEYVLLVYSILFIVLYTVRIMYLDTDHILIQGVNGVYIVVLDYLSCFIKQLLRCLGIYQALRFCSGVKHRSCQNTCGMETSTFSLMKRFCFGLPLAISI